MKWELLWQEKSSGTLKINVVFLEELQINYIIKGLKDAEVVIIFISPPNSPIWPQ